MYVGHPVRGDIQLTAYYWKDRGRRLEALQDSTNAIYLLANTVHLVSLCPDIDFTLADAVAQVGKPEGVYIGPCGNHPCYVIYFDYPNLGITFESYQAIRKRGQSTPDAGGFAVLPEMRVTAAHFYSPTDLESALRDVFFISSDRVASIVKGTHEWRGFVPMPMTWVAR
jgi:hypothetical protein